MDRRHFLWTSGCALAGSFTLAAAKPLGLPRQDAVHRAVRAAEKASGGRLGLSVLNTADSNQFSYRGSERFPMCSTFKILLAAAILTRVDHGAENLDRRLAVAQSDILGNSPFTAAHAGSDASIGELCQSTVAVSDNAAANLLLPLVGGPAGVTRFLRSIGDNVTRLDRNEPTMGECTPGDPRDTSTPLTMTETVRRVVLGSVLTPPSRQMLEGWMRAATTGQYRLRAGLPSDWQVADKTGTGGHGTTNDVAVIWPPERPPLVVVAYLTESPLAQEARQAILARVGKAIGAAL